MVDILKMSSGSVGIRTAAHGRMLSYGSDASPTANTVVLHRLTESSGSFSLASQEMKIREVGEMARALEEEEEAPNSNSDAHSSGSLEAKEDASSSKAEIEVQGLDGPPGDTSSVATTEVKEVEEEFEALVGKGSSSRNSSNAFSDAAGERGGGVASNLPISSPTESPYPFIAEKHPVEDEFPAYPQIRTNPRSKSDGVFVATPEQEDLSNGFVGEEGVFSPGMPESPGMDIPDSRYFELEFARREAENQVEQLKLQLKSKTNQLEQVQVALMSYEEEIMNLRKQLPDYSSGGSQEEDQDGGENGTEGGLRRKQSLTHPQHRKGGSQIGSQEAVSLETAEALSSKIVELQTHVVELEEDMVRTKLENAQLREANDFLKSTLNKYAANKGGRRKTLFARG